MISRTHLHKHTHASNRSPRMAIYGERCRGSRMWRRLVKMCNVYCACVLFARVGEGLSAAKLKRHGEEKTERWMSEEKEKWCITRKRKRERGSQLVRVINDFARRSQTVSTRLGGVRIDSASWWMTTNQPCPPKIKWYWFWCFGIKAEQTCKDWHAQTFNWFKYQYIFY